MELVPGVLLVVVSVLSHFVYWFLCLSRVIDLFRARLLAEGCLLQSLEVQRFDAASVQLSSTYVAEG